MNSGLARSLRALRWLAIEGLGPAWRDALWIAALRTIGVIASSAALGLPLLAVTRMATGSPVTLAGVMLAEGAAGLASVAGLTLLLGAAGVAASYGAAARAEAATRRFHRACAARAVHLASAPDAADRLERLTLETGRPETFAEFATATSMTTAFALRALLNCIAPIGYTLLAGLYLAWRDPALSALLLGIAALHLGPYLWTSRSVARHQRDYRIASPAAKGRIRRALSQLGGDAGPGISPEDLERVAIGAEHERLQDALYGRFLATARTAGVANLFLVSSVCAVLLQVSAGDDAGPERWSGLVAYLVGLRVAWTGVGQLSAELSQLSRFVTEFERFGSLTGAAPGG